MTKRFIITIIIFNILFLLGLASFVFYYYQRFLSENRIKDVADSQLIAWGKGWEKKESFYGGSEFRFAFKNSKTISFFLKAPKNIDQGLNIYIDGALYNLESPNLEQKNLTITVENEATSSAQSHTVRVVHYCAGSSYPCDLALRRMELEPKGFLINSPTLPSKSLAILGDSLTVAWGWRNYSFISSNLLNYQLRDASVFSSSVSEPNNNLSGLARYKKDVIFYQPDAVVVFLGTNDLDHKTPPATFEKDYATILQDLKQSLPKTKILALGLLRRRDAEKGSIQKYSQIIKNVAQSLDVKYADTFDWLSDLDLADNVHPSLISQANFADKFNETLKTTKLLDN